MVKTNHFINEPEAYVSPACETIETSYEQVLCVSRFLGIEEWEEDEDELYL